MLFPSPCRIINFGITSDTFGISSSPTKDKPDEDSEELPALVFINAVDPSIPITSNKSMTLPSRQKLPRSDLFQTSFESVKSSESSEENLLSMKTSSRSAGAINKIENNSQPLKQNLELQGSTKQKANSSCLPSPLPQASDVVVRQVDPQAGRNNDGYVFMEPLVAKQVGPAEPPCDKVSVTDLQSAAGVNESLNAVPKTVGEKGNPTTETEANNSCAPPSVDTSHYDVPRKLLEALKQQAIARNEAASTAEQPLVTANGSSKEKPGPPPKPPRKDSLEYKAPPDEDNVTSAGTTDPRVGGASKPEGIYDVPRSILKQTDGDNSLPTISSEFGVTKSHDRGDVTHKTFVSEDKKPVLKPPQMDAPATVMLKPIPRARTRRKSPIPP